MDSNLIVFLDLRESRREVDSHNAPSSVREDPREKSLPKSS